MKKYTPGPWSICKRTKRIGIWNYHETGNDLSIIADCSENAFWKHEYNITLIAAAPDMYEALKTIQIRMEYKQDITDNKKCVDLVNAVVAKIEEG